MRVLNRRFLPYALLLPGLQLLVVMFAITPELMVGYELHHRPHTVTLDGKVVPGDLDLKTLINIAVHLPKRSFPDRVHALSLLNMPGVVGEIIISLPTTWPESWFPESTFFGDLWTWRALSWAFYTLPLWWMAGRAFDSLKLATHVRKPCLRGAEVITMMVVGIFVLFIGVGLFFFGNSRKDDLAIDRWMVLPGLMWFGFGMASLAAWQTQRRASAVATTLDPSGG